LINHEFLRLWRSNGDFKSGSMVSWKIELRPELGQWEELQQIPS